MGMGTLGRRMDIEVMGSRMKIGLSTI
jgi:hypothetical protein